MKRPEDYATDSAAAPKQKNLLIATLLLIFGNSLLWLFLGRPTTGIDDANIFFVYARHLAQGHGFVYNIGGEVVEGFTSMLWTLLCAGCYYVFQTLENPALALNLFLGVMTVKTTADRATNPWAFFLLLAATPAWFLWCQLSLMETGLWCLLLTLLGLAIAEKRNSVILILLPLLVLTRPESMLWGAWSIVLIFALAKKGARFKSALLPALAFGTSIAMLTVFRLYYFGHLLPNTYYAKVTPNVLSNAADGIKYFREYLTSQPAVFVTLCLWLCSLVRNWNKQELSFRLAIFILPGLAIPILVGGDHFDSFRFYQPLWPLLCLIAIHNWPLQFHRINKQHSAIRVQAGLLVILVLTGWITYFHHTNIKIEFDIAHRGQASGAALTQMFQDLETWPTVGVITAGGSKLTYPGHVYDLMGLNSTEMAHAGGNQNGFRNHEAFNPEVFFKWHPDIVLNGESYNFDMRILLGLYENHLFKKLYTKCTLHRNTAEVTAYFRNEFLKSLPKIGTAATNFK